MLPAKEAKEEERFLDQQLNARRHAGSLLLCEVAEQKLGLWSMAMPLLALLTR